MSSDIYKGVTGAVGPRETSMRGEMSAGYGSSEVSKATPLSRLEHALSRLHIATDQAIGLAMALTGGWPHQGAPANGKDAPASAGVFGAVEDIASNIHRVCDRLEEANSAVSDRLP